MIQITDVYIFAGLCRWVHGVKDLLPECLHDVECGRASVRSNVPVPGEEDVQVSDINGCQALVLGSS